MRLSRILPAALPLAAAVAGCAGSQPAARQPAPAAVLPLNRLRGHYLATPPTIDGKADDWTDSLHYDPATKLRYAVLNDSRNVYVRLKSGDTQGQAKIVYLGLVVWLDSTGRGAQQLGIRFPLAVDPALFKSDLKRRPEGAPPLTAAERDEEHVARMRSILQSAREIELLNFRGSKEPVLTDSESKLGVKAAAGVSEHNEFVYELAVPLRLLYRHLPATTAGSPPALVGLYVASQRPKTEPGSNNVSQYDPSYNGGGMGGSGMGGMGGGGYGRGMNRPMTQVSTFVPLTIKTAVQLGQQ